MIRSFSALLLASTAIVPLQAQAQSLPTGGSVAAGSAEIGGASGGALSIRQTSGSAVINWQSFNVDQGNRVDIVQPSTTAVLLNRVTGGTTTTIAGQLNANGRVFIVNPNGILITATGGVKAAGFVGSTLDINDKAFMAGRYDFDGSGDSVVNAGHIEIARGGYAALLGGRVSNSGLILAPLGKVAMGTGSRATLDFSSDGFLKVAIGADQSADLAMSGRIAADGGSVILSAAQARAAVRSTVNLSGVIEARGIETSGGSVTLTGGNIALTGAIIDVSGKNGGGSVKVGGDRQGLGSTARADMLRVDTATSILADATEAGAGGDVVLWSDRATDFAGTISARGIGAKGGEAEVSSKGQLGYAGTTDLTGSRFGTLLLDPYDLTISNAASSGMAGFAANANNSVLNAAVLTAALATANVTVQTGSGGTQAGNITVAAPLTWSSNATLTLDAANNISLNSAITGRSGGLTLSAGGTISQTGAIAIGRFELSSGFFSTVAATLPDFEAGSFAINGGSYLRAIGGSGSRASPWLLTDIYGVQGMTSRRFSSYALANVIDASDTVNWNAGAGFRPIGGESGTLLEGFFGGTLDGRGFAIENLYIRQPSYYDSGFFSRLQNATIRNLRLTGATIEFGGTSFGRVAGLAPFIDDSIVDNVHIDGRFTASGQSGIAAGIAHTATNSTFTNVSVQGSISATDVAAGMVYILDGTSSIRNAYVTASVTANNGAVGIAYVNYADTSIDSAWVSGLLTSQRLKGAIVIGAADGTIGSDVYWDIDTTTAADAVFFGVNGAVGLTSAQARTQAAYAGLDFTNTWFQTIDMRPILRSEAAAVGTDGYIPVSSLNQLQLMSANLGANYRLANDIDAAAANGVLTSGIWGSGGFVPIGLGSSFNGNLDGANHAIRNLTINRATTELVGLISQHTNSGPVSIRNLRLIDAAVTGAGGTGAVVGLTRWNLANVWATGTVIGGESTGGIAGNVYGGTVTNVHFDGAVHGGIFVGGLFGTLGANSSVLSTSGSVTGNGAIGGLIGQLTNDATLTTSFSTSSVAATGNDAGGIVGSLTGGTITNVWASGAVTAVQHAGGLVGTQASDSALRLSYWDMASTGRSAAVGAGSGNRVLVTGLTTAQARNPASYTSFSNFDTNWYQGSDMRPILRGEALAVSGGTIGVFNARQLQLINANLSGNYTLLDDIDLATTNGTAASAGIWGASGWTPLGTDGAGNVWGGIDFRGIGSITSGIYGFTGALYGDGYSLTNLSINRPTIKNVGLFGVSSGTIDDLTISGAVIGASGIGGLVGMQKSGTITDSTSAVNVVGTTLVGGLIGNQVTGTIIRSNATGTATGTDDVGGLVGYAAGSIEQSFATGPVNGTRYVGGLIGYLYRGLVSNSYATGDVNASVHTAGSLIGKHDGGAVADSYASGDVAAPLYAGGLIGQIVGGGTVTNSVERDEQRASFLR